MRARMPGAVQAMITRVTTILLMSAGTIFMAPSIRGRYAPGGLSKDWEYFCSASFLNMILAALLLNASAASDTLRRQVGKSCPSEKSSSACTK